MILVLYGKSMLVHKISQNAAPLFSGFIFSPYKILPTGWPVGCNLFCKPAGYTSHNSLRFHTDSALSFRVHTIPFLPLFTIPFPILLPFQPRFLIPFLAIRQFLPLF